ncbi:PRD domain-containing protein [Dielma fastidiosa]|uniref:BglG family transcriptional antiterminator n=1 Tax=Dielma fastidiosa TaxID=1034346 RepID=A0A318KF90_9FIRM|nr:PRD domain-containing protein [Dielma fastidiosa]PXX75950.1 BglG family transcriptional antiterminator [Dielma fastidiosa]
MKVIKNINNNVSICLDSKGTEIVVFGRGIGFCKPPYELDIQKIQQTFYNIDPMYIRMIQSIPEEMIDISAQVIDYARTKIKYVLNSNIIFTLADHLNFAIQRYRQNLILPMPMYYDVKSLYELEYDIGVYALDLIYHKFSIRLPKEEIASIVLHLINAAAFTKNESEIKDNEAAISFIKKMIEKHFQITISEDDYNYSRFVSHLQYLMKRGQQNKNVKSENATLYESIKESFPEVYQCALKINDYLNALYNYAFNDEELLYLMLHINRLCVREDCHH